MERRPFELAFKLGDIPVVVEPSFWVISLLFGAAGDATVVHVLLWTAIVFLSVLVHELGHAAACKAFGAGATIRLYSFGGLTYPSQRLSRVGEVLMSLAGPFAGFTLGGLMVLLARFQPPESELAAWFLRQFYWVNFIWGIVNLLPVPPLDGGHVLSGLLGDQRRRLSVLLGAIFAALISAGFAWYFNGRLLYPVLLFGFFAYQNFRVYSALGEATVAEPKERPDLTAELAQGWAALSAGDEKAAARVALYVLKGAPDAAGQNPARDLLAWVALAEGNSRAAIQQLEQIDPPGAARALTWAMALESVDPAKALEHALVALEQEPSETTARLALKLSLKQQQLDRAEQIARTHGWQRAGAGESALAEVAFARGQFPEAADHYQSAYSAGSQLADAYNAACALARSGDVAQALIWLRRCFAAGFQEIDQLKRDPDLEAVRQDPSFGQLLRDFGFTA